MKLSQHQISRADPLADQYYGGGVVESGATGIIFNGVDDDVAGIDIELPPGYSITGQVFGLGNFQPGIDIDVFAENGEELSSYNATTASNGFYEIGPLPNSNFIILADPSSSENPQFFDTFYGDTTDIDLAATVAVSNAFVAGIDITLVPGFTISGTITNASANPLAGVDIDVFAQTGEFLRDFDAETDSGGNYEVGPFLNGSYYVLADPGPSTGPDYLVDTYYGDTTDLSLATLVTVPNDFVTGINIIPRLGGTIAGSMLDSEGNPLPLADIKIYDSSGDLFLPPLGVFLGPFYSFQGIPAGAYYVRFEPTVGSGLAGLYYPDEISLNDAKPILVAEDQTTEINFNTLPVAGTVSGVIRDGVSISPLHGIDLDVFDLDGNLLSMTAESDIDGSYTIGQLPAGLYIVKADPDEITGYNGQYYDSVLARSSATPVSIVAGVDTPNIDFNLLQGGWISGTIRDVEGTPLEGIDLDVYNASGVRVDATVVTAVDGTYSVGPLPDGDYYVRADPDAQLGQFFVEAYYGDTADRNEATLVTLSGGSATGIDFNLQTGGAISGTIREPGGLPLNGFDLDIFDLAGNKLPYNANSRLNGTYVIGPVPTGSYLLRCDPEAGSSYVGLYYEGIATKSDATPILVAEGILTSRIDFALFSGGTIQGTVWDESGTPLSGVDMDVYDATGVFIPVNAKTSVDGTYSLGPLADGDYLVKADPEVLGGQFFVEAYYGGTADRNTASVVKVSGGSAIGIDFNLIAGGAISGTILGTDGLPLSDFDLDLFDVAGNRLPQDATSGVDGTYVIGPMPAGDYLLKCDPPEGSPFVGLYYDSFSARGDALHITVVDELITPDIDFNLFNGGYIEGLVTDGKGNPLDGVDLDVFNANGTFMDLSATTIAGAYSLGPLADGDYFVRADPDPQLGFYHIETFYGGAIDLELAIPISVTGGTTLGINISLKEGGIIRGTIRNLAEDALSGIDLDLFDGNGNRVAESASSQIDGNYAIGPVPAGSYIIKSDPSESSGFTELYYNNAVAKKDATLITVTAGLDTTGVDFDLFKGGWISGTIRNEEGTALANVDLDVYTPLGTRLDATAISISDGSFTVGPLPPGDFLVRADPDDITGYLRTWYPNAFEFAEGTPVTVAGTNTLSGIDFNLSVAGWIEGRITDDSGNPLIGIDLDVFQANSLQRLTEGGLSGEDGHFVIGPLPVQDILVRADPSDEQRWVREYYTEEVSLRTANSVSVNGGVGTMNIDFTLEPGSSISGTVVDPVGGSPVAGVDIDVYRAGDLFKMDQNAKTGANGSFTVGPLPEGTYLVKYDARARTAYLDIYYDGTEDISSAIPVILTADSDVTGIDSILPVFILRPEIAFDQIKEQTVISFRFQTQIGKNYTVEYSDSLIPGSWTPITTIVGEGLMASYDHVVAAGSERRFYRIKITTF